MFESLNPNLKVVADRALIYCKAQHGAKGLKVDEGIHSSISWRPTFYLQTKKFEKLAIEVSDIIYPDILKGAAQDFQHYDALVRVAQVIPLEVFVGDKDQRAVQNLRMHGIGLFTVSEEGLVVKQFDCMPLIQFVPEAIFESAIKKLPSSLKVRLRLAYETFRINPIQGVQDAGQVVEGLTFSMAKQQLPKSGMAVTVLEKSFADLIDILYQNNHFKAHRAALGAARGNAKFYRNPNSHAPKSAKDAAQRMRQSKEGFLSALKDAALLADAMKALGCKIITHG